MWQTPGTKTLVPQEICTWLHLSHQHHYSSNCTCTLGPRYCNSSLCLTLGSIVTLTACVPGLVPRRIPSVRAFPMDHKKRRGPQKSSLLRTPVALASTATYRISLVLATEDTGCFCWDCHQLMELQRDYVAVPSQESEMLHYTPPSWSPRATGRWKSFSFEASLKRLEEVMLPQMHRNKCKAIRNVMISEGVLLGTLFCLFYYVYFIYVYYYGNIIVFWLLCVCKLV